MLVGHFYLGRIGHYHFGITTAGGVMPGDVKRDGLTLCKLFQGRLRLGYEEKSRQGLPQQAITESPVVVGYGR